jgi:hypothetical protein
MQAGHVLNLECPDTGQNSLIELLHQVLRFTQDGGRKSEKNESKRSMRKENRGKRP